MNVLRTTSGDAGGSGAFEKSTDRMFKNWWCDGVDEPVINDQFTSRNITSLKQVITKVWIGADGNNRFDMILKLDRCSRRKALKGFDLEACLPDSAFENWVEIDTKINLIIVKLN